MKVRELLRQLMDNDEVGLESEVKIKVGDEGTYVPVTSVEVDDSSSDVVISDT